MKYDFTTIMDRHGRDSIAVDAIPIPDAQIKEGFSRIPMWVADMNFATVPTIQSHIIERVKHPAFGYFSPTDEYFNKIIEWQTTRNQVTGLTKEAIGYENGVLGGVMSALQVLCSPGDSILLHSPTYIGFTGCITNYGYHIVHSDLVLDEQGIWRMDYEDMDRKLKEHKIHAAVFCSPHNPCGRVWERWEIEKAMDVYRANDCFVISDEIWSDLTLEGYHHIPTQSVSEWAREHVIALYAPSKTFNLAGLIGSYHIIYNTYLRERVEKQLSQALYDFMLARAVMSDDAMAQALMVPARQVELELGEKNIMSVDVPAISVRSIRTAEGGTPYGFAFTSAELDGAIATLSDVLPDLLKLAEAEKQIASGQVLPAKDSIEDLKKKYGK